MITVALAKGALLKDSVRRFAAAGLDFAAVLEPGNRQLMVPSVCGRARALLVRNADVPVYVAYGQAQLGVVGYDVLKEHQLPVAQLVDLGFGGCRMSVAVKASSPYRRALQTAELALEAGLAPELAVDERLAPGGALETLLTPCDGRIGLVGHEPDLGQLACGLLGLMPGSLQLKKAGLVLLRRSEQRWQLDALLRPGLLLERPD